MGQRLRRRTPLLGLAGHHGAHGYRRRPDQYSSPVSSFLSDDYLSVRVDDSLSTVLEKVADYGEKDFGILPVLDAEGAIRGFLNRSSLLSTLSRRFIDEPGERDEQEGA